MLTERLKLPPDVANGLVFTLLKDVEPTVPQTTVSYVVATPKPRLVYLEIIPQDQVHFSIGSYTHKSNGRHNESMARRSTRSECYGD